MTAYVSWLNGVPAEQLPLSDRGLAYGDGAFETIRLHRGQLVWAKEHLNRLYGALERLGIPLVIDEFQAQLADYLRVVAPEEGVVKVMVTRGSGGRGYSAEGCAQLSVIFSSFDLPERSGWAQGISLYPCELRLGLNPALAGLKHLNRLEQVLARSEWSGTQYQEGLLLDLRGHLVEGTMSNLFLCRDQTLLTPELSQSGVAGIARAHLLKIAPRLGLSACETVLTPEDLNGASEVFCCNSVFGIWPVTAFKTHIWPAGPMTRLLQSELDKALND